MIKIGLTTDDLEELGLGWHGGKHGGFPLVQVTFHEEGRYDPIGIVRYYVRYTIRLDVPKEHKDLYKDKPKLPFITLTDRLGRNCCPDDKSKNDYIHLGNVDFIQILYNDIDVKRIIKISDHYRDWLGSTQGYSKSTEEAERILKRMRGAPTVFSEEIKLLEQQIAKLKSG